MRRKRLEILTYDVMATCLVAAGLDLLRVIPGQLEWWQAVLGLGLLLWGVKLAAKSVLEAEP